MRRSRRVHCATPIETAIGISVPTHCSASARQTSSTRRAIIAPSRSVEDGSTMQNSSPPVRASMSPGRSRVCAIRVKCCRQASPAAWPWVSLMALKPSRSITSSANGSPLRSERAHSSVRRCTRWRRLPTPVRSSSSARSATSLRSRSIAISRKPKFSAIDRNTSTRITTDCAGLNCMKENPPPTLVSAPNSRRAKMARMRMVTMPASRAPGLTRPSCGDSNSFRVSTSGSAWAIVKTVIRAGTLS